MSACEWCWTEAYNRTWAKPEKTQTEWYSVVLREQDELGAAARCPNARKDET